MSEVYEGLKDNLMLYSYLMAFQPDDRLPEYQRIVSKLKFKVKSYPYLMKVGARVSVREELAPAAGGSAHLPKPTPRGLDGTAHETAAQIEEGQ